MRRSNIAPEAYEHNTDSCHLQIEVTSGILIPQNHTLIKHVFWKIMFRTVFRVHFNVVSIYNVWV